MDTDFLYLALSEENLEDVIFTEKQDEWNVMGLGDCTETFTANKTGNSFPRTRCAKRKKQNKKEPGLCKEEFRYKKILCLWSKTRCCYDRKSNKYKFSNGGRNKRALENCGVRPKSEYRKLLDESVNVTSTNRGSGTVQDL